VSDAEPGRHWSLDAGLDLDQWPVEAQTAVRGLRQGTLIDDPPFVYAAAASHPIHDTTRAWAKSPAASTGVVNVINVDRRPAHGLIVTQTCDLVEEGKPKRPWVHVAPVYRFDGPADQARMVLRERGLAYLVPVDTLGATEQDLWVADLRLLVAVEKGWLVNRRARDGFESEAGFERLRRQLENAFARNAYASQVVEHVLKPVTKLLARITAETPGEDPVVEIGLRLGRSRLEPTNAQLVFLLASPISDGLRDLVIDSWAAQRDAARQSGLEVLQPEFALLDLFPASEYRRLDLIDISAFSPETS